TLTRGNQACHAAVLVDHWCKHGIRTHDRRHLKPLLYPTELTCWRQRPRPRAVHASAIHSAGAPGGTHEPAPLTRLPSRPRCGTAQPTRARPDGMSLPIVICPTLAG